MKTAHPARTVLHLCPGPRAVERAWRRDLDELVQTDGVDLEQRLDDLKRPVHILVPSRQMRHHVMARALSSPRVVSSQTASSGHKEGAIAGVAVHTLRGLALEVLARAGESGLYGAELFDLWTQRGARRLPRLQAALGGLADGYATVPSTVRDLLEAGFEPEHAQAATEALHAEAQEGRASRPVVERAVAIVELAAFMAREFEREGLCTDWMLLRRARELLSREDADRLLPCRTALVIGFSDATAVAADWIEALIRHAGGHIYLDLPDDPGRPATARVDPQLTLWRDDDLAPANTPTTRPTPTEPVAERAAEPVAEPVVEWARESAFAARLEQRWRGALDRVVEEPAAPSTTLDDTNPENTFLHGTTGEPALVAAPDPEAEVAEVARRIWRLLAPGATGAAPNQGNQPRPEDVAIVVRDPAPYGRLLARRFKRWGIPFSATRATRRLAGSMTPAGRLARALLELLSRGEQLPLDRWLELHDDLDVGHRARLRQALFGLGRIRLRDLHRPATSGTAAAPRGEEDGREEDEFPTADGIEILPWIERGRSLLDLLDDWPAAAPLGYHLDLLQTLLDTLGWRQEIDPLVPRASHRLLQSLEAAREHLPLETPVVRDELRHLLSSWWETPGRASLEASAGIDAASWGGGVQILSVTEARSLTFEHLFVLGLNRHHFPRTVREDPLLPDSLRTALTRVLPDLAVRRRSFDEERYLFAQLLAAAPHRTLSWASADRDGRSLPTSPLVDRLRYRPGIDPLEVAAAPEVAHPLEGREAPSATADRIPQTLWHHLLAAGVAGERETFEILLAPAWREALDLWPSVGLHEPVDPTAAWVKTLAQLAPDLQSPEGQQRQARLGPFFGLVGFDAETARRLHVTALEQLAACPWQTYLQRVLRLVPSLDPLLTLPALTPPLVGRAVHEALECLAANQLPPAGRRENTVSHARQRSAAQLEWPSDQELDRLLLEAAETTLSAAGIRAAGLRHALAARLRPFVDVARQLDEADPTPLLGSEVRGELELNDTAHPWRLAFQVDRIERLPQGGLRLTDFKTGRPPRLPDQRAARHEALLRAVRQGRQLQAATYALAATAPRQPAEGRYVYLRPADEPIAEPASPTASLGAAAQRLWSTAGLEPRLRDELPDTLERLAQLWRHGAFFPRLVEPKEDREPRRCSTCSVAEACLRGDSGARRRLRRAVEDARADPQQPAWMEALLEVWDLPLR